MYQYLKHINKGDNIAVATVVKAAKNSQLVGKKLLLTNPQETVDPLFTDILKCYKQTTNDEEFQLKEISNEQGVFTVMIEYYHPVSSLLVLGGGHIAKPLVAIATMLQYQITVIDDRPTFANGQRFPGAHQVICGDFQQTLRRQKIGPGTSVVIVTRGHKHDLDCLEYVLGHNPGYVGMIGSRRRVKIVKEHLYNIGYSIEQVNRVHMPIGLDIGAQTPEEIAVSIAAQLVQVRRGAGGTSTDQHWNLLEKTVEYVNHRQPVVSATIIYTKGSTPRKAGAKMLVLPDGTCHGTIGGGCGEGEVRRQALMMFDDQPGAKIHPVMLDAETAAEEGMVCGGLMDVFLERLI